MKLKIRSALLAAALRKIERAATNRSPLPILAYALAKADRETGALTLTATDLESTFTTRMEIPPENILEGGEACFVPHLMGEVLNTVDEEIALETETEKPITATWGRGVYHFATRDTDEFPIPLTPPEAASVLLTEYDLRQAITQAALFTASQEEQRKVLTCVRIFARGGKILVESTDSRRLYRTEIDPEEMPEKLVCDINIPQKSIILLASFLADCPGDYQVKMTANHSTVFFESEKWTANLQTVEGKFPNTDAVIGTPEQFFSVDNAALQGALKRVLQTAFDKDTPDMVKINLADELIISSNSLDVGDGVEMLEYNTPQQGYNMEFACNGAYLLDACKIYGKDGNVKIGVTSPTHPVQIRSDRDEITLAIVMPVRLRKVEE